MASEVSENIFQCSKCNQFLDLASKTLPCLHSLCRSCLEVHIEGTTSDNGRCPQCHEPVTSGQFRLAPFLEKSLKRRHLESSELRCHWYLEDLEESVTQIWCPDCQKLLCQNCQIFHKRFHPGHKTEDLLGMARDEAINVITTVECRLHHKSKDTICRRCNVCLCDTCFEDHVAASPQCPPQPLSMSEEASKAKKRGPILEQELREFEIWIGAMNKRTQQSIEQLSKDCDLKCYKIWHELQVFLEEARLKAGELCDNIRETTSEQVRKWRLSLKERNDLLEKVKIWCLMLSHLSRDDTEDEDIVCGLRSVEAKLSSPLHEAFAPAEKAHLDVAFPNWCHDSLNQLEKEMIGLTVEPWPLRNLEFEKEWTLPRSNLDISSILVSDKDGHVFVSDWKKKRIKEFRESGEFLGQCFLSDGRKKLRPQSMCFIPNDIIVVCGEFPTTKKLFFLHRIQRRPFLKIQKTIDTEKEYCSLCQMDDTFFACNWKLDEIDCFSKNGEKINTVTIGGVSRSPFICPLLCADPTTGNLWVTKLGMSEIFVFNQNRKNFPKVEIEEEIFDFCANKYGEFYFSTKKGIFSALSKKDLHKFQKNINVPLIVVSTKKMFVCQKNDDKYLMKIFKINY